MPLWPTSRVKSLITHEVRGREESARDWTPKQKHTNAVAGITCHCPATIITAYFPAVGFVTQGQTINQNWHLIAYSAMSVNTNRIIKSIHINYWRALYTLSWNPTAEIQFIPLSNTWCLTWQFNVKLLPQVGQMGHLVAEKQILHL